VAFGRWGQGTPRENDTRSVSVLLYLYLYLYLYVGLVFGDCLV
jgi:hypothetical protein